MNTVPLEVKPIVHYLNFLPEKYQQDGLENTWGHEQYLLESIEIILINIKNKESLLKRFYAS